MRRDQQFEIAEAVIEHAIHLGKTVANIDGRQDRICTKQQHAFRIEILFTDDDAAARGQQIGVQTGISQHRNFAVGIGRPGSACLLHTDTHAFEAFIKVDGFCQIQIAARFNVAGCGIGDQLCGRHAAGSADQDGLRQRMVVRQHGDLRSGDLGDAEIVQAPRTAGTEFGNGPRHFDGITDRNRRTTSGVNEDALGAARVAVRLGVLHVKAVAAHQRDDAGHLADRLAGFRRQMGGALNVADAQRDRIRIAATGFAHMHAGAIAWRRWCDTEVGGVVVAVVATAVLAQRRRGVRQRWHRAAFGAAC